MDLTWPAAAWVLGGFVRLVVAVEVSITLPGTLDEAASVGAAELFGSTCRIFCSGARDPPVKKGSGGKGKRKQSFTHRTPETRRSRRCSRCRGRT